MGGWIGVDVCVVFAVITIEANDRMTDPENFLVLQQRISADLLGDHDHAPCSRLTPGNDPVPPLKALLHAMSVLGRRHAHQQRTKQQQRPMLQHPSWVSPDLPSSNWRRHP